MRGEGEVLPEKCTRKIRKANDAMRQSGWGAVRLMDNS
jgi:hypothetical protein